MIGTHIQIILVITGAITAVAVLQFIAPAPVLRMINGAPPADGIPTALARHWGLLIFLIGALLIYAAFNPAVREPAVVMAAVEKIVLGIGVLGSTLRAHPLAAIIAAADSLIAFLYVLYLVGY